VVESVAHNDREFYDRELLTMKWRTPTNDPGLQLIADYEAAIVKAHDQRID